MTAPAYQRIKDYLVDQIQAGIWREGDLIPSENELARQFDVARMTVNRAVRELADEDVLRRVQGAGTFVAAPKYQSTLVTLRSIAEEIRERGHQHSCQVLKLAEANAPLLLAQEMAVEPGADVYHSVLLHRENGLPIQLEDRWVNPPMGPGYLEQDFRHLTPNEYLVRFAPLERAEYRIEARMPDPATRELLAMGKDEPCLVLHRRTFSQGKICSVVNLYHPAGRYRFSGHF
ncbi:histidine utilization repressor [Parachitinimonas caeni]|uniref:Histidine utilization repressor n=1 Tax=Parachitinimonas caeni TaxID=3031301 RepID=A0ABT7DWZ0_9NEIS|nr:histidine utilization repressor [Parachitinimonas caeni]MDK2124541.1 histidine utilization repressor [Parachitinimonas caeni]